MKPQIDIIRYELNFVVRALQTIGHMKGRHADNAMVVALEAMASRLLDLMSMLMDALDDEDAEGIAALARRLDQLTNWFEARLDDDEPDRTVIAWDFAAEPDRAVVTTCSMGERGQVEIHDWGAYAASGSWAHAAKTGDWSAIDRRQAAAESSRVKSWLDREISEATERLHDQVAAIGAARMDPVLERQERLISDAIGAMDMLVAEEGGEYETSMSVRAGGAGGHDGWHLAAIWQGGPLGDKIKIEFHEQPLTGGVLVKVGHAGELASAQAEGAGAAEALEAAVEIMR